MINDIKSKSEKFSTLLGIAPGNVPVYSSDYDTLENDELYKAKYEGMGKIK